MPMSHAFQRRLFPKLPAIAEKFGTPFHFYDEDGIRTTGEYLKGAFRGHCHGFREFYAVKALPNPRILEIMLDLGFGFDCSSTHEVELALYVGARGEDIMFTSNNTTKHEFAVAQAAGAIINLDDVNLISKVPNPFPELVCFRFNPGESRTGNSIIGAPHESKYGITWKQLVPAYHAVKERGATRFGIHTMVCSNQRNYRYMIDTVRMLLGLVATLELELDIRCEFINMGGGIGIPYKPRQGEVDIEAMAEGIEALIQNFRLRYGWTPRLFMESGRYITGPHGVLVNRVINRKEIYQTHVGVEVAMPGLMRHAIYGAYHHATVLDKDGVVVTNRPKEKVNIVGPICENCDRLATGRILPRTVEGDFIVTHDTGAHGLAMGFNYNGRTRPQELLLRSDGSVERIRRAETNDDLWRTLEFKPSVLNSR